MTLVFQDPVQAQQVRLSLRERDAGPVEAPWLFAVVRDKKNRASVGRVNSALSPAVIGQLADALRLYRLQADRAGENSAQENRRTGGPAAARAGFEAGEQEPLAVLEPLGLGHFLYTARQPFLGQGFSRVDHHDDHSIFLWAVGDGQPGVAVRWQDGVWPGLSLQYAAPLAPGDGAVQQAAPSGGQWWVPDWLMKSILAELANQAQVSGSSLAVHSAKALGDWLGFRHQTEVVQRHLFANTFDQFIEDRRQDLWRQRALAAGQEPLQEPPAPVELPLGFQLLQQAFHDGVLVMAQAQALLQLAPAPQRD